MKIKYLFDGMAGIILRVFMKIH